MTSINYDDDSINLDDLFLGENYATKLDNLLPNSGRFHQNHLLDTRSDLSGVELHDFDDFWSSFISCTNDEQDIDITGGIFPELQTETQDSLNGEQPIGDVSVYPNPPVASDPLPQPIIGNEEGIMYQMCPMLSDHILGQMSVKQQPKANRRFRYACDGARFLPQTRYEPMSINVKFSPVCKMHC